MFVTAKSYAVKMVNMLHLGTVDTSWGLLDNDSVNFSLITKCNAASAECMQG